MPPNVYHSPILNWVPSHVGLVGNEAADRAATKATHRSDPDLLVPLSTSLIQSVIQRTAIDLWQTVAEYDPEATKALGWNLQLKRNKHERQALAKAPRAMQREIYRLRLRVVEPRAFEGTYKCLQCYQFPRNQVKHYLAECQGTLHVRRRLLLRHIYPPDRHLGNSDLALTILNRQAERFYQDLLQLLAIAPRR